MKSKKLEEAYVLIRELVEDEEDNYSLWQQAIYNASLLNEYDDILELGNRAISYFPNKPDLYLYIGIAHFQKNQFLEAGIIFSATSPDGKLVEAIELPIKDHPFFILQGNENIVSIYTNYYKDHPLTIRGPGAGADLTASGVLADVLRITRGM